MDLEDIIIVGSGISGINAAYHVQKKLPGFRYSILEARSKLGGTWDLFQYPGIRSDTDLLSFGFSWNSCTEDVAIASGSSIASYLHESAVKEGIERHIEYDHRVVSADWPATEQIWHLQVVVGKDEPIQLHARF